VAPQCNEDQGYFIMGEGSSVSRNWMYLPPDVVERQSRFVFVKRSSGDSEVSAGEEKGDEQLSEFEIELIKWKDSNHECILFNNIAHTVAFLSARPKEMKNRLHPMLMRHLEQNSISVEGGTGLNDSFASSHWKTLSALTGVLREDSQASQILGGTYCLTGDSLLKILAIVYRVTCGIPVVLLGECGCGKTMLLRFLCAWMDVTLLCLDVHGGTSESDIISVFERASALLNSQREQKSVFVFLDEINTCGHMGLITEAICHRSINGQRLNEGIQILAALNPYRVRPRSSEDDVDAAGLEYTKPQLKQTMEGTIDMKNLVYKVHPIPPTLRDFIFDFGSLDDDTELLYIQSMVAKQLSSFSNPDERSILADMISRSQIYLREYEGDPSVVSLRDVQRCLDLLEWFYVKVGVGKARETSKVVISPLCRSAVLAIALVYGYRLPSADSRKSFFSTLTSMIKRWGKTAARVNFDALGRAGFVQTVLENMQRKFVNNLMVEPSIAMNQALTENLFVTIICILNQIPIFIVGKPGTSKTLAIQIIASNLQGALSPMPLWRKFPAVYIFQYQCSPLSTSASILYQYESAKSYQEHSEDVMTVLLLDEVGLAENSPDMPLKVLHYMLVNPPIAIVGLSNWSLDSSKMNRAICLQRPEPSAEDIMFTGQNIVGVSLSVDNISQGRTHLQPWLMSLARAFHTLYSDQKAFFGHRSRNFIGMRDYYSLLKYLRDKVGTSIDPETLALAVARNFGGRPDAMDGVLDLFHRSCFDKSIPCPPCPPSVDLIQRNLLSSSSRHLMILSANDAALQLLIGCKILDPSTTTVLVGSRFKDDLHELHIIQQINQVHLSTLCLLTSLLGQECDGERPGCDSAPQRKV
jgi:E3 ubiquitin-protein ligase RNF213